MKNYRLDTTDLYNKCSNIHADLVNGNYFLGYDGDVDDLEDDLRDYIFKKLEDYYNCATSLYEFDDEDEFNALIDEITDRFIENLPTA